MSALRLIPALAAVALFLGKAPDVGAKPIKVEPKTTHSALTQTTDGTTGYQVLPGKPMRLDLVGPGNMKITVRLNSTAKRATFKGRFEIKRGAKVIKRANLKLHRSRVGAYRETSTVFPSLPKVFKIKVPEGVQKYTFSIRAAKGTSLTVRIVYNSEADQSKAQEDDPLALVPLVPAGADDSASGDIPLVPLAPVASAKEPAKKAEPEKPAKVAVKEKPPPVVKPVAKEPKEKVVAKKTTTAPLPPKKPEPKPAVKPPVGKEKKTAKVITISPPKEPTEVKKPAPAPPSAVVSIGLKGGQISPLQQIAGTTFTGSLDIRYILPVFDGRLTLGVEAGYYPYTLVLTDPWDQEISLSVVPISLQLFYRLPLGTFIEPFLGAGGDIFIWFGESKRHSDGEKHASGSGLGFGGHVAAGLEAEVGPGFIVAEVRAGISFAFLKVPVGWEETPNISGLATLVGYRFQF
jgi:hypothetical protein